MHSVFVYIHVKPEDVNAFIEASKENVLNSLKEPGVIRFDFYQMADNPNKFVLVEIYQNQKASADHKETSHYQKWRDTVAEMMAEARQGVRYLNILPTDEEWK